LLFLFPIYFAFCLQTLVFDASNHGSSSPLSHFPRLNLKPFQPPSLRV
jgi:hypothetical protein